MIVLDTGGLYAAIDANEPLHGACVSALLAARPPRLLSPFVLAELDYLIGRRVGQHAQRALLDEVARSAYQLEPFSPEDVRQARDVLESYADLDLGLTDASVIVIARHYGALDLLCTDQRHFRAVRGPKDRPFRLLPYDV